MHAFGCGNGNGTFTPAKIPKQKLVTDLNACSFINIYTFGYLIQLEYYEF